MNLQLVIIVVGLLTTIATCLWGIHLNNYRSDKSDAKIDILRAEINQRFDAFQRDVNYRFDGMQRDFNQFYQITGKLEGRVESIEKRPS